MKNLFYFALIIVMLFSCQQETKTENKEVIIDGIDESIKPGDDFFSHVNKNWYNEAVIDDDQVGVGYYRYLNIPQKKLLQKILDEVSHEEHSAGSIEQKIGDLYASGMDTVSINNRGFEPIKPVLAKIDSINNIEDMLNFIADQYKQSSGSIIGAYINADDKNSDINILHFVQSGTGLPDRDYYFKTDSETLEVQEAYKTYLSELFRLTENENSLELANTVYGIEKELATSHKTRVERRNVQENYHKMAVSTLDTEQPNIGWKSFLSNLKADVDSVDVRQPAYYEKLNTMLDSVSLSDWKIYLKAHTISDYANILSQPFQDAAFEYSKVLSGQSVQKPRAQLMAQRVDGQLGFALGQLYVKRYFNEDAKKRALELVNNLQKAFEKRIDKLDWMSDSTKVKAKEKLYAITKKIGYPDVWREYDVNIDRNKFFENVVVLRKNQYQYELKKLNQPPNKHEWHTTPSTVTAYYNPTANEIVFPAGILQAPYFDFYADDALNYGGIGMVIGHELTHAFDDQGAQFDGDGNLKNWWTQEDYKKFKARTDQIIEQYDQFTVLDSVHLKGALTVGENTADNGGIAIAYDAFKMTEQGQDTTKIGGYTPDQRFFLNIARIWRVKVRDEFLRNYVATDPHSPAQWRVNGPLMNFTPFYDAFGLQPGEENYRTEEERVKVW